jgi:hypothetical protein
MTEAPPLAVDVVALPNAPHEPYALVSNPSFIARMTGAWELHEHVTPHSLVMTWMDFCDYSGPSDKPCSSIHLPGLYNWGILYSEAWFLRAVEDTQQFCLSEQHYAISPSVVQELNLAGAFTVLRSSGQMDGGWTVDVRKCMETHYTMVGNDEVMIHMLNAPASLGKHVPLHTLCTQRQLNMATILAGLQNATREYYSAIIRARLTRRRVNPHKNPSHLGFQWVFS